jgi:hypothetical protein
MGPWRCWSGCRLHSCHPGQAMRQHRAEPGPIAPRLDGSRLCARFASLAGTTGIKQTSQRPRRHAMPGRWGLRRARRRARLDRLQGWPVAHRLRGGMQRRHLLADHHGPRVPEGVHPAGPRRSAAPESRCSRLRRNATVRANEHLRPCLGSRGQDREIPSNVFPDRDLGLQSMVSRPQCCNFYDRLSVEPRPVGDVSEQVSTMCPNGQLAPGLTPPCDRP